MAWQDEVAELRRESGAQKATKDAHDQNIDAVLGGSENVVAATDKLAKTEDIDSVIEKLKEIQLSTLLSNNKPSVVLTDQTDLGDKISELATKFESAIGKLDNSKSDAEEVKQLKNLNQLLQEYIKAEKAGNVIDNNADKALLAAIESIEVKPVVNVPAPKVTVQSSPVDLKPLQSTLESYFNRDSDGDDGIDLDDYYAQDIDNTNPDIQYVGFLSPVGNWYIIENDVKGNRMRYVFGSNDYAEAFAKAATFTYSLLNEAMYAVTA